ncbi:MAG TPA: helix-turn-helix domain-containing protein [Nitriliruptorales bacterium]|nr:helix-turn-helix domain-containing protein [Nitriliruptorales bacterium]
MTVPEFAALLKISRRSAYRAVEAGVVHSIRIGRRILIPTTPVLRMLGIDDEQHQVGEQPSS